MFLRITLCGRFVRLTLGGDTGHDVPSFARELRRRGITPHLAAKNASYSTIDGRTTRQPGYALGQKKRKLVEQLFGWTKTVAVLRKTRHRGREKVDRMFVLAPAAYNLIRIRNLTWRTARCARGTSQTSRTGLRGPHSRTDSAQ